MNQSPRPALPAARTGASAHAVRRLSLSDFRCYAGLRLEVDARPVVLTGPNGAGKTNLLEALSLLSPGRGMRRARLGEFVRRDAPSGAFAVAARLDGPAGWVEIGTGLQIASERAEDQPAERRSVRIDGQPAAGPQALAEVTSLAWLTPQMDRLFIEAPSGRRRFLDRLTFGLDPAHARRVAAYEKAMRERNRLLRAGGSDPAWLAALEGTMAEWAVAVAAARRDALARFSAALDELPDGPFPRARLAVRGRLEDWLDEMPALDAEDRYRMMLRAQRQEDMEAGGALEGPHRSDLLVRHAAKDMPAEQCSTGEQKALLIAILLADVRLQLARRGATPVLLLDEVAAHLDQVRRAALFAQIGELGAQAWMTGTEPQLFEALRGEAQFFTVRDGRLFG
ncbi:MAG: DNA replication/repair protein RecF [Alphaproteobacteria bacterium]|nr:DNA replication/repair protein RecF [Alphaproteobacteria bacterium]